MSRRRKREDGERSPPGTYHIRTNGGAVIMGNVRVEGGDLVGRDKTDLGRRAAAPQARPPLPPEGEPQSLLAAALNARRLLLVWADTPFPPEERPPRNPARLVDRWREGAGALPPTPFEFAHGRRWPLAELPPLPILSLDPSERLETAFRHAGVVLSVVRTRHDVPARDQHSLLKLGGDLRARSGLLLTWEDVRAAPGDPDKAHLLREARHAAQEGAILVVSPAPTGAFSRLWRELVAPHLQEAPHHFALGPEDFSWPAPLVRLEVGLDETLTALAEAAVPLELEPCDQPAGGPAPRRLAPPPALPDDIRDRLDRLLVCVEDLRRGQEAGWRSTVDEVLAGVRRMRLDDAQAERELRGTLDGVRRALIHLQERQLPQLDSEVRRVLDEVTAVLGADVDLGIGLELVIPLFPLLLRFDLGGGLDLRQAWESLVERVRRRQAASPHQEENDDG